MATVFEYPASVVQYIQGIYSETRFSLNRSCLDSFLPTKHWLYRCMTLVARYTYSAKSMTIWGEIVEYYGARGSVEYWIITYSPPEGVARYCFTRSEEISIWNVYRILIGLYSIHWKKLTFIGQRSRSQGQYIAFWRYSHITKTEP